MFGTGYGSDGVCLEVSFGHYRLLLDCGLAHPDPLLAYCTGDRLPWLAAICTSADPERCRALQALHLAAPDLPIYGSEATIRLAAQSWGETPPSPPQLCLPLPWGVSRSLAPGLTVQLLPAGGLPGAACIVLRYAIGSRAFGLFYSGRHYLSNARLAVGLSLETARGLEAEVVAIGGYYGTNRHPPRRTQENRFAAQVAEAIAAGQSVLLPVPAVGIGQEILAILRSHHLFSGRDIDIWVDRSVAAACDAYLELMPQFPASVRNFAEHQPLFWDRRIGPRVDRLEARPVSAEGEPGPCIVLADRASAWTAWLERCPQPWLVLLPEEDIPALAAVLASRAIPCAPYLLADRSDGAGTAQLIHTLKPQHVVFVDGAPEQLADLADLEELRSRYHVHCPRAGSRLTFALDRRLHGPEPLSSRSPRYTGEVVELESEVMLSLPRAIADDPRWRTLSDTGAIEVRWAGNELIVRGLSQRELLDAIPQDPFTATLRCCRNCRFYRERHCCSPDSPLYGREVASNGYCPAFAMDEFEFTEGG